jgi:recombination protein RecT
MSKEVQKTTGSLSERFSSMVMREYSTEIGQVQFDQFKKKLAQHLFIKVDMALKDAEARRNPAKSKTPIVWANVNIGKLAIDAVHRIELQLDALIPNHIHPIPYYNTRAGKYDVDLRIGYAGKDYYFREMALRPPTDIRIELVHANDHLSVMKKDSNNTIESYEFKVPKPFDRGPVVGGFGYISYDDPNLNKLVLVYMSDFDKAKKASGTDKFWGPHEEDMQRKTIIHRVSKYIILDPKKINKSFAIVEDQEYIDVSSRDIEETREIIDEGNTGEIIDIVEEHPSNEMSEEEKAEILAEEIAQADHECDGKPPF